MIVMEHRDRMMRGTKRIVWVRFAVRAGMALLIGAGDQVCLAVARTGGR